MMGCPQSLTASPPEQNAGVAKEALVQPQAPRAGVPGPCHLLLWGGGGEQLLKLEGSQQLWVDGVTSDPRLGEQVPIQF